jgi:bla regulator protein blaR1
MLFIVAGWAAVAAAAAEPDWQTAAGGKMAFEVASVRRSKADTFKSPGYPLDVEDSYSSTGGYFSATFQLISYIQFAYKVRLTQEQVEAILARLPKWAAADFFDVEARAESRNPSKDQMRLMVQSLLADRFKLAVHFEDRQAPALAMSLVKPGRVGPKLRPHADGPACDDSAVPPDVFPSICDSYQMRANPDGTRMAGARNTTMASLVSALPLLGRLGRVVVDKTGLSGKFDFTIGWSPEPGADDSQGPTFLEALRDQLGMKMESTQASIQTLIVDHIEIPSEN